MMRSRSELPRIRKVQSLSNQKALVTLGRLPNHGVDTPAEPLILRCMNIMHERFQRECNLKGKIFVNLDSHRIWGIAGTGRSSSADAAAKVIAACISSGFKLGKSVRIVSGESPAARLASTVRRVTRVPLNT